MKRHLGLVSATFLALGLGVLCSIRDASAQATDIKPKKPNALMVLDNSGSMRWGLDGTKDIHCTGPDATVGDRDNEVMKPRWTILAETLTGTIEDLECWNDQESGTGANNENNPNVDYTETALTDPTLRRWVPYQSNDCRVYENMEASIQGALSTDPYAWPQDGNNDDDNDAIAFCEQKAGSYCNCEADLFTGATACGPPGQTFNNRDECNADFNGGGSDWSQEADGMLDIYSKSIRFGMASFDTLQTLPSIPGALSDHILPGHEGRAFNWFMFYAPLGGPDGCQFAVDGTRCKLDAIWRDFGAPDYFSEPQYSYWYLTSSNWLEANPGPLFPKHNAVDFPAPTSIGGYTPQSQFDIGIRNSRARPSMGRLIGFGPQDWDLTVAGPLNNELCNDEDSCTERHNFMVQQAILGAGQRLQSGTPLAATMRDTYHFIRNDDQSEGVHLPHDEGTALSASLKGKIGPKTDTYWTASPKCRETSVILVTDGEPSGDLNERMSDYADDLNNELDVRTYVIGIGLSHATWNNAGTEEVLACDTLTDADLGAGRMCERSGNQWKFASVGPFNVMSNDPAAPTADPTPPLRQTANEKRSSIRACCELLETAYLGGTDKAFYPKTQTELKQRFSAIFNYLSGGASSRTVPIYGATSAAFSSAAPANAAAVYYELRSSMNVTADNSMWRGNLERVRYQCAGFIPAADPIDPTAGDLFQENLDDAGPYVRKFFTVNTLDDDAISGTIRSDELNPNVDDLFDGGNEGDFARLGGDSSDFAGTTDDLVPIQNLASGLTAIGSDNARRLLDLNGGDASDCDNALGDNDLDVCADRVLRWFGGDPDPDDADTVAPSRSAQTGSQCVDVNCSPMGAIYRSVPVIVPPPTEADSDDQSYGRARVVGTDPSFVAKYGGRPSMVYSQTIDGLLHAFVLSKNDYTVGGVPEFNKAPAAVTDDNNEIWSFLPPAIIPELWGQFNQHSRMLDGQMAWANVVYDRIATDVTDVDWDYNTVLVGASGVTTHAKGFYYALDVTDPFEPKFLWQLRTSGDNNGEPEDELFGNYTPGAAIATIRHREPVSGVVRNVAVAILPGGTPTGGPHFGHGHVRDRRNRDNWIGDHKPRERIQDWRDGYAARSLTFVELKTGRILARISGDSQDNPNNLNSDVIVDNDNAQFDSPISGIPVAYPNGIGQVADRVYVGDIDGTMWRIDLHDPNPKAWTADIAFDAYNFGGSGDSTMYDAWVSVAANSAEEDDSLQIGGGDPDDEALVGQPIQNAPLLSLDEEGNLVVTFSTGDQEAFQTEVPDMVNLLISFPDVLAAPQPSNPTGSWPAGSTMIRYEARMSTTAGSESGLEMAFKDGASVTGPVNLFDSQLFFAYFKPGNPTACTFGSGGLCGVNYGDRTTITPRAQIDLDGNGTPGEIDDICAPLPDGQVVFGVSVNHVPACAPPEPAFNDPWLGGQYNARTTSQNGKYQLVYHTGQGGDPGDPLGKTNIDQFELPTPQSRTRVRTWVSVVE